jgi:hypothetical protein
MVLIFKCLFVEKLSVGFSASMKTVNYSEKMLLETLINELVTALRQQPISLLKLLLILKKKRSQKSL